MQYKTVFFLLYMGNKHETLVHHHYMSHDNIAQGDPLILGLPYCFGDTLCMTSHQRVPYKSSGANDLGVRRNIDSKQNTSNKTTKMMTVQLLHIYSSLRRHSVYCLVDELRQGSFYPRRRTVGSYASLSVCLSVCLCQKFRLEVNSLEVNSYLRNFHG